MSVGRFIKLFIALMATCFCGVFIALHWSIKPQISKTLSKIQQRDNSIYKYVLKNWYNLSKEREWYNEQEKISMFDKKLIKAIRNKWILVMENQTDYSGLIDPEVEDPSMGQSRAIREIFKNKKNGFFVECGAYDGETRSNTLYLERFLNWSGILIEADPINFAKLLQRNRRAYLSPTCLSIQPRPIVVPFLMADNVGRIHSPENHDNNAVTNSPDVAHFGQHIDVQCFPFASYITALDVKTVDYFSLDVEGNEMEVLRTIPFDLIDIKTLSVEYTHVRGSYDEMLKFMDQQGYSVHSFVTHSQNLANDVIFVKKSILRSLERKYR